MTEYNNYKKLRVLGPAMHYARLIFTPLSIIVITFFVWQSRGALGEIMHQGRWSFLLVAVVLWTATNIFAPLVTVYLFRSWDMQINYTTTLFIHCNRLPAKYLPGGIWHSVGRAADYSSLGHRGKTIGLYFLLENFLLVAVTLGMSAGVVQNMIRIPALQTAVYLLPFIMGLAVVMFPVVLRIYIKPKGPFSVEAYYIALGLLLVYWCMIGITFVCYISAFEGLQLMTSLIETAAIYIFSWVLGYMALFAPQGIGVAEFISGTLLSDGNQAGAILALLVGFRVLVLVADLMTWFIISLITARFLNSNLQ